MSGAPTTGPGGGLGTVTVGLRRWWVVALLGLISIAAGVLALAYPDITLLVLGLILGVYLLIAGTVAVVTAAGEEMSPGVRTAQIVVGFLAALAGLICLVRPGASVLAVLLAVAFWFTLVGIADLTRAAVEPEGRILYGLLGAIEIAAGVILLVDPDIGLTTVALLAGIGLIVRGSLELVVGLAMRGLASARG